MCFLAFFLPGAPLNDACRLMQKIYRPADDSNFEARNDPFLGVKISQTFDLKNGYADSTRG